MQPQVAKRVEVWLREQGHEVTAAPMPPDAVNGIIDCFLLNDEDCARRVVELRSRAKSIVFTRVQIKPGTSPDDNTFELVGYWFEAGRPTVTERRDCERCTPGLLREQIDSMMSGLAKAGVHGVGKVYITSQPVGATVTAGGKPIGVTPLTYDLPPGKHQLVVGGSETRDVVVRAGQTTVVEIGALAPATGQPPSASKLPLALMIGGGVALAAGVALYATSETDNGEKLEYRDTRLGGALLGVAGLAAAGVGGYLFFRGRRTESTPTVTLTANGATIGWAGTF